jgi:hypothetical protein
MGLAALVSLAALLAALDLQRTGWEASPDRSRPADSLPAF